MGEMVTVGALGRSVSWMSWGELQQREPDTSVAVIVVLNPGHPGWDHGFRHGLGLRFWDVSTTDRKDALLMRWFGGNPARCVAIRNFLRGDSWPWRPPLEADAEAIHRFVSSLPPYVSEVVVACEHGKSRSRAIAEWVGRYRGCRAQGDRSGQANPILARLLEARA